MKEMVGGCCVCSDERGWPENPLVYCDGGNCNVAVHQACYGIVTVPTGPWYCRKCESQERSARVRCELCPSRTGALKKTNTAGWAHVVCALYIPEVRFGNVTTMEPINLDSIPAERYSKTCYICQELNKGSKATMGACMQCNKTGCRQQFHVTCAQQLGLLCEEAGNYLDNVKYCGYCQHHYSKLKKGGNVKLIPPYKPITYETGSSDGPSSPEKESDPAGAPTGGSQHIGSSSMAEGPPPSSSSSMLGNSAPPPGNASGLNTAAMSKGMAVSGTSNAAPQMMSSNPTNPSNPNQLGGGSTSNAGGSSATGGNIPTSSANNSSKNRKSSSVSKGSSSSTASNSGASGGNSHAGGGGGGQQGNSATGQSSSSASSTSGIGSSGGNSNGSSKSSSGGGGSSSVGGSSSKEHKEKHSKGTSKTPTSKDRDTYKEKSSKSTSSSTSSSSSSNSSSAAISSSKNKDGASGGSSSSHHHQSQHADNSQMKMDHGRADKSSSGSGGGGGSSSSSSKAASNSSILAPSVLQQATAKDVANKYPYSEANNADISGSGLMDATTAASSGAGGSFGNESKLLSTVAATASSTTTVAAGPAPVVSTKKRKASDSSKLHSSSSSMDEKMPMKDVSVTLIPLRTIHHDKNEVGDSKKVKSERGSPHNNNHNSSSSSDPDQHPSPMSGSSPAGAATQSVNLLATQTGATSISITKLAQPTTTNVIIKPPIIKDIGIHLPSATSSSSSAAASGAGPTDRISSGNGSGSLVVSVPLSPVNLGTTSASANQNLFQQAIQNRSEHLNFSNTSRSSSQPSSQTALSRASPIIAGGHMGGGEHHGGMHHRQSPLIQSSSLGMDNGGRVSLSPSISGNVVHQSDSGMLKVTYEKQSPHGNIVNPGNTSRLAVLQDDAMSSSRRSSADSGIFQSASSSSSSSSTKGLFHGGGLTKRGGRDYGVVTSSSGIAGDKEQKGGHLPSPSSNLFANATGAANLPAFKSSVAVSTVLTSAPAPFSSFITSSRTPDFNSFSGGSSSGGLKISYEPQAALSVSTTNTALLTPSPSPSMSQMSGHTSIASNSIGAQPMMKDSPPSSPNSEAGSSARKRSRKQQDSGLTTAAAVSHGKVFQNGVHASHMLGNQLNPNSSVAQKMSDQLHMELEAHSVYTSETNVNLVGPMFPGKQSAANSAAAAAAAANKAGGSGSSQGPPSLSSMLSGGSTASGGAPQSLEQLLERQWEQGSQFLMEQAQHFDIASLLSCLHQLRAENVRLEDHVNNLVARRDHLLAVNARLAIPLNQATAGTGTFNSATNGPMDTQPPNVIQRGIESSSSSNSGRSGGGAAGGSRGMSHGSYAMENGIDFRSAAQQQQAMMMGGGGGHQGGAQGPGSGGNSSGIARNTTAPGSGVVMVAAGGTGAAVSSAASSGNNGGTMVPTSMSGVGVGAGGGPGNVVRVSVHSSSTANSTGHPLMNSSSSSSGSSSTGGGAGIHSNGSLLTSGGPPLMGVMGNSVSNPAPGMVGALGMISGTSRVMAHPPTGISYPVNFQQFRRDDAQMKPS